LLNDYSDAIVSAIRSPVRNIWEYSHVARAVFAMVSLMSLTIAVTT
jgi:hypothetical protein